MPTVERGRLHVLSGCSRRYSSPPLLRRIGYRTRYSKKVRKYFLISGLRRATVTRYTRALQNTEVSLFCHYRPVKISEIEGNQVRSKTAASYWLTRGYDLFPCACRNGKKRFSRPPPSTARPFLRLDCTRFLVTAPGRHYFWKLTGKFDQRSPGSMAVQPRGRQPQTKHASGGCLMPDFRRVYSVFIFRRSLAACAGCIDRR